MPSAIVETPSQGDAINAPVGADVRNAASVRVPFQAVGNRLKFLEDFYDFAKALVLGGTLAPAADVVVNMQTAPTNEGWLFTSTDPRKVRFSGGALLAPGRRVVGPLFAPGTDGRANKRVQRVATGSPFAFNALVYDTLYCTPSADVIATLSAVTYELDDSFTVFNTSGSFTVTVKEPGGSTLIAVQTADAAPAWAEFIYNGTTWNVARVSWG